MSYRMLGDGEVSRGVMTVPTRDVLEFVKALGLAFLAGAAATAAVVGTQRLMRPNLSKSTRASLPEAAFALEGRRFPVHTRKQAKAAIAYLHMGRVGSASDYQRVRTEIMRRYGSRFWVEHGGPSWEKVRGAKERRGRSRRGLRKAA